jgi:hypothetical protein
MAHFAEIDDNNVVLRVLVVPNEEEHRGEEFLSQDLKLGGRWIQTSYNGNIRKMYAGVGYIYNEELDIFLPPKPYPSWVLNTEYGEWESPTPRPVTRNKVQIWNEDTLSWTEQDYPFPFTSPE